MIFSLTDFPVIFPGASDLITNPRDGRKSRSTKKVSLCSIALITDLQSVAIGQHLRLWKMRTSCRLQIGDTAE